MNKVNVLGLILIAALVIPFIAGAQEKMVQQNSAPKKVSILTETEIKTDLDRIFSYLDLHTPAKIIDSHTQKEITDYRKIDSASRLAKGSFSLTCYEWGVTYSGMLKVTRATGDKRYAEYTFERLKMLGESFPFFEKVEAETGNSGLHSLIDPRWLDDCGSVGAAMLKASMENPRLAGTIRPIIDTAFNFVMHKEYRLENRLLARKRPNKNSVWIDDMYMGIPPIAWMAKLVENENPKLAKTYYDEAALQIELFNQLMWVPEKNLYRHGWIEMMGEHPSFHWGRANGWALLAISDVLDVLPENHPERGKIMDLFLAHIRGIVLLQSGEGFWHQLLDRNDSYLETSATAIFTYCIAHAINKGWIDAMAYGPVAHLGWKAVATKINEAGQVEGTCVGTGMGFDPAFYYNRPVNVLAAHGYGPVLLAGAEMIQLLKNTFPKINDDAVMFYRQNVEANDEIFEVK